MRVDVRRGDAISSLARSTCSWLIIRCVPLVILLPALTFLSLQYYCRIVGRSESTLPQPSLDLAVSLCRASGAALPECVSFHKIELTNAKCSARHSATVFERNVFLSC